MHFFLNNKRSKNNFSEMESSWTHIGIHVTVQRNLIRCNYAGHCNEHERTVLSVGGEGVINLCCFTVDLHSCLECEIL